MDREILFRAVSQLDGNWVYGSLIKYDYERPNMEDLSKPHIESSYDICRKESDWCFSYKNIPVFKETIGQFTGLTDKNETKIFEGDVVKVSGVAKAKIIWNNEDACFAFDYGKNGRPLCLDFVDDTSIEVIGNIYDNPELLEDL